MGLRFGKSTTIAYDTRREEMLIPNCVAHPQIAAFARLATENTPPTRSIEGQKTQISRTMHAFGYDAIHDEIVVTSPLAGAILSFRGAANGEEPPLRVIQGPRTQIRGVNDKVAIDPANNEILLSQPAGNSILIFDREANGDMPPKRVLGGPATQFRITGGDSGGVAVDPVRNLLVVNSGDRGLLIFDRTASGNTPPKRVIKGPVSGITEQAYGVVQIHPEKGWIVAVCFDGAVCAWDIEGNGDIAPNWRIPVERLTGFVPSGLALDPAHKEIIFTAVGRDAVGVRPTRGIMNTVITFSWPEIF
jgi:hypothetical protein